jgi:hypothetical protein
MKGIDFTEPLFHKVISGEKTQTRRIVKPQPQEDIEVPEEGFIHFDGEYCVGRQRVYTPYGDIDVEIIPFLIKPKYKIGETLYLKEPYDRSYIPEIGDKYDNPLMTAGDPKCWETIYRYGGYIYAGAEWRNAIFMPAKYARYFIEITGVRVERLQDISDEDCMREGCIETRSDDFYFEGAEKIIRYKGYNIYQGYLTPQQAYATLINKTYGKGTWESNPYVWVYDFKLVKN